jgi:non-specific serine/threonine protein kinase
VQIVTSLPRLYWWERGATGEGLGWLDRALARVTALTMPRARALLLSAYLALWHRDADAVLRLLEEGQQLAERWHDAHALAFAAYTRAQAALLRNYLTSTIDSVEQGLAILATMPEQDLALRLHLLFTLGSTAQQIGDLDRAERCFQEIGEVTESHGETFCRSTARYLLGLVAWLQGRAPEADHHLRESLRAGQAAALHNRWCIALVMECLAWTASGQQRHQRAATLLAAADTQLTYIDKHLPTMLTDHHDACAQQTRDALGNAAFTAAVRHGQELSLHDALAYALADPAEPEPSQRIRTAPAELTPREFETARLIAGGLSNKEIATAMVISRRTVESYVEHILAKLDFANRTQVAAWITATWPGDRS